MPVLALQRKGRALSIAVRAQIGHMGAAALLTACLRISTTKPKLYLAAARKEQLAEGMTE